jgi:hypothetical protein
MKPNTNVRPNTAPPIFSRYNMPYVYSGLDPDNPLQGEFAALTGYQYAMMEKWARGDFYADWMTEPVTVPLDDLPLEQQSDASTRAALEGCIGAPFFPGIEVTCNRASGHLSSSIQDQAQPAARLSD